MVKFQFFFSSFAKQEERGGERLKGVMFLLAYTALQGRAGKQGRKEGRKEESLCYLMYRLSFGLFFFH